MRDGHYSNLIIATVVRSTSAFAFAAQVVTVAMTSGPLNLAIRRHLDLGYRFWMNLGSWNAALAFASLIPSLVLAISWHNRGREGTVKDTRWCVWLNIGTIAMSFFVPAIAVSR